MRSVSCERLPLRTKNGIDAFRFPFQEFQNRLDAGEDGLFFFGIGNRKHFQEMRPVQKPSGRNGNALRGEVFFSVIMRSLKVVTSRRIAKLGLVE